jgi:hypothetical protein
MSQNRALPKAMAAVLFCTYSSSTASGGKGTGTLLSGWGPAAHIRPEGINNWKINAATVKRLAVRDLNKKIMFMFGSCFDAGIPLSR